MKISKIKAENFKSYSMINISLNNLNYIIGGNAAGKSNFINIFKFLSDLIEYGLDDAILLQGGVKYLFNVNSKKNDDLSLKVNIEFEEEEKRALEIFPMEKMISLPNKLTYQIKIRSSRYGDHYKIYKEFISIVFDRFEKKNTKIHKKDSFVVEIKREPNGIIKSNLSDYKDEDLDEIFSMNYFSNYLLRKGNLLNNFFDLFRIFFYSRNNIKIYNFDINMLKSPSSIIARSELDENGSNLVNVIQQLLKSKPAKDELNNLIKNVLPFVDDIEIEKNVNKSLFFKLKECYTEKEFPSYLLSDGTVNILAIIVALYFQRNNDIIIIEEPEQNIHPKLLSALTAIFNDISLKKQLFITTHNPYILKNADINDILLVSRNENGISMITKPAENEEIKFFLENDLGISDLFADGILK